MYLQSLAPVWRDLYRQLVTQTHVLVVEDENAMSEPLLDGLAAAGYLVTHAPSAESALARMKSERFDVCVVDHELPGQTGIEFIRALQASGTPTPCVLTTGEARVEIISEALAAGAADYVAKPFTDFQHLLARVKTVVDRTANRLLFDVIVRDLSEVVRGGALDDRGLADIQRELFAFKQVLAKRSQVMIYDSDDAFAGALRTALEQKQVSATMASGPEDLFGTIRRPNGPLTVVLALEMPNAALTIKRIRREDPQLEVLATLQTSELEPAQNAVDAGASDFVLREQEGLAELCTRVQRLVAKNHRHRLYLHLVGTLYHAARKANPALADDLILARSEDDAQYIRNAQPAAGADVIAPAAFPLDGFLNVSELSAVGLKVKSQ
jgi:DNA-binding NtrC family response regulator